jgi:hypothetical protein
MHPSATDTLLGQTKQETYFFFFLSSKSGLFSNSSTLQLRNSRGFVVSTPGPAVGKKLLAIKLGGRLDRTAFHTPPARPAHTVFRSTLLTISPRWTKQRLTLRHGTMQCEHAAARN